MDIFSQNEIVLMIGVVSVLLICIIVLTILDIKDFLKDKKEGALEEAFGEEFKEIEEPVISPVVVEETVDSVPGEILISDIKDETMADDIFLEEMEDETFEMPVANVVNEEVVMPKVEEVAFKEKKRLSILDELEEMDSNLPNEKDDITNFEMEQERTAIISLDELMKKSNELYDSNEVMQYDDGNEPITIDEVMAKFKKEENILEEKEVPEDMKNIVEDYSKNESVPFVSNVYGIETKDNALEFENTATYEKLDRQNYNDFVGKLREMNENK